MKILFLMFIMQLYDMINVKVCLVWSVCLSLRGCVFEPWLEQNAYMLVFFFFFFWSS